MAAATASACSRDAAIAKQRIQRCRRNSRQNPRTLRPVIVQIRSGGWIPQSNGPWPRAAPARDAGTPSPGLIGHALAGGTNGLLETE